MSNLQILIPLLITTIVAVVGWYIAHFLSFKHDRASLEFYWAAAH